MNLSAQRILVVDDLRPATQIIKIQLEKTGRYLVREENNPLLALAAAREFKPDLILLDVDMPGMDGGEVARQLQGDEQSKDVPVIFLTSLITKTEALLRNSMENFHFLPKPAPPSVLISILDSLFRIGTSASGVRISTNPSEMPASIRIADGLKTPRDPIEMERRLAARCAQGTR
jgi:CheY-like chemotaxis protein